MFKDYMSSLERELLLWLEDSKHNSNRTLETNLSWFWMDSLLQQESRVRDKNQRINQKFGFYHIKLLSLEQTLEPLEATNVEIIK